LKIAWKNVTVDMTGVRDMKTREEYIATVKARLDAWSAEIRKLEETIEEAEEGAKHRLKEQVESLRRHRQQAQDQIRRIEDAAEDAWHELARGAEEAWKRIGNVFARPGAEKNPTKSKTTPPEADFVCGGRFHVPPPAPFWPCPWPRVEGRMDGSCRLRGATGSPVVVQA
jgi:hypothetical protein